MFAIYAEKMDQKNPLSGLKVGEMPEPEIPEGWLRVKISHASLNRHDIFTLQGLNGQSEPIKYPMILGNDGAGTLDDGTEIGIYPVMGSADWRGDEMLDPKWHVFSELVPGTMAEYVAGSRRISRNPFVTRSMIPTPPPSGIKSTRAPEGKNEDLGGGTFSCNSHNLPMRVSFFYLLEFQLLSL